MAFTQKQCGNMFEVFTDTLYTFATYCVSAVFGLWRQVSMRVRNVLARFSPQVLAVPTVSTSNTCECAPDLM